MTPSALDSRTPLTTRRLLCYSVLKCTRVCRGRSRSRKAGGPSRRASSSSPSRVAERRDAAPLSTVERDPEPSTPPPLPADGAKEREAARRTRSGTPDARTPGTPGIAVEVSVAPSLPPATKMGTFCYNFSKYTLAAMSLVFLVSPLSPSQIDTLFPPPPGDDLPRPPARSNSRIGRFASRGPRRRVNARVKLGVHGVVFFFFCCRPSRPSAIITDAPLRRIARGFGTINFTRGQANATPAIGLAEPFVPRDKD